MYNSYNKNELIYCTIFIVYYLKNVSEQFSSVLYIFWPISTITIDDFDININKQFLIMISVKIKKSIIIIRI